MAGKTKTESVAAENKINSALIKEDASQDENMIGSSLDNSPTVKKTPALKPSDKGVISSGSASMPKSSKKSEPKPKIKKVAILSTKNVNWLGVGALGKGYNIVTPEQAEQWLTRSHVREATPEEVAESFEGQ
jgi:hypothetical protein